MTQLLGMAYAAFVSLCLIGAHAFAQQTPANKVFTVETVTKSASGKAADLSWKDGTKQMNLLQFGAGKVMFLNFWATWCPPCRKEIPDIIELSKEFSEDELMVIGISMDRDDQAYNTVSKFARLKNIPYSILVGNDKVAEAYDGIGAIPTTFIINSDGTINEKIVGQRTKEEFKAAILRALKRK
ncbi:MAG: TlpA family protein disulfide reductase [Bacteroidota bacterium]|nr:TlpA family protein disulfide reductase [bacterium]NBP63240.1 TlpA family protein disulfide reductase [Bacteroidota bacterium]